MSPSVLPASSDPKVPRGFGPQGAIRKSVLYLSYDGLLEPLGQSQVLSYIEVLQATFAFHIISFEKASDYRSGADRLLGRLSSSQISWLPRRYHKRPSAIATAYDVLVGITSGLQVARRHKVRIIHARSYVPALMALVLRRFHSAKFVFDMRGFWADERVEGGIWPESGLLYKLAKWCEDRFLRRADHIVVLTKAAAVAVSNFECLADRKARITVIPTCADLKRFRPLPGLRDQRFTLGYVGSIGTWYMFEEVVNCFRELLMIDPSARLLVVNRNDASSVSRKLLDARIPETSFEVTTANHEDVPNHMARMHAGVFFYRATFSRSGTCPTKMAELLGCGIPCLSNHGVGDVVEILEGNQVGVVVNGFEATVLRKGLEKLMTLSREQGIVERCVRAARQNFCLEIGADKYRHIYEELAGTDEAQY